MPLNLLVNFICGHPGPRVHWWAVQLYTVLPQRRRTLVAAAHFGPCLVSRVVHLLAALLMRLPPARPMPALLLPPAATHPRPALPSLCFAGAVGILAWGGHGEQQQQSAAARRCLRVRVPHDRRASAARAAVAASPTQLATPMPTVLRPSPPPPRPLQALLMSSCPSLWAPSSRPRLAPAAACEQPPAAPAAGLDGARRLSSHATLAPSRHPC